MYKSGKLALFYITMRDPEANKETKMLIDFCDGRARPVISCDKVYTDSNPVENLVSMDSRSKARGFIAENFVRPPVNITVQFPCNIELCRVVINPVVGAQKSSGFEVFSCSNKVDTTHFMSNQSCEMSYKSFLFVPLGKITIDTVGEICFTNRQFRFNDFENNSLPPLDQYDHHRDLRHGRHSALTFVSHVTVRITRTFSGSAVCIRRLEIWGRPSRSCPKPVINKLEQHFSQTICNSYQDNSSVKDDKRENEGHLNRDLCDKNDLDIPEDFLDSITVEIMTVPMLLPCGKNIDLLTLEKHNNSEASWGRMPSDPFTGIVFDRDKKAVPNVPLKGRIDQFVLANSDKLKLVPRTLGRSDLAGPSISRLTNVKDEHNVKQDNSNALNNEPAFKMAQTRSLKRTATKIVANSRENVNSDEVIDLTYDRESNIQTDSSSKCKKRKGEVVDLTVNEEKSCKLKKHETHDDLIDLTEEAPSTSKGTHSTNLCDSLNTALASALGKLPSFTKTVKYNDTVDICHSCKSRDSTMIYRLSCSHLICRTCLTASSKIVICKVCKAHTDKCDVVRTHIK